LDDVTIEGNRSDTVDADLNFFLPLSRESISSTHRLNLEFPEVAKRYSQIKENTDGKCHELVKAGIFSKYMYAAKILDLSTCVGSGRSPQDGDRGKLKALESSNWLESI
jgi:hypothetical protein